MAVIINEEYLKKAQELKSLYIKKLKIPFQL